MFYSPTTNKHWEAELATLKSNNAKLTAALLESTANVKQWKQQLAAYQEEAERLHKRVRRGGLTFTICNWENWEFVTGKAGSGPNHCEEGEGELNCF